ncbi:MAG: nucleotidyltransferase domain-containing protein [Planctomycetes bacterium]|nr:nucleotidyltransferase domain-containing protein [Planctomycetota bacterium]
MPLDPEAELLVVLARAVSPAPELFVVIGGAAHKLFRSAALAQPVDFPALRTFDTDVAIDASLKADSFRVDEQLSKFGFHEKQFGGTTPPVTRHESRSLPNHYIEFVTHRTGSGETRLGVGRSTKQIAGTVAQRLPHVDLLLQFPWTIELRPSDGYDVGDDRLSLRIANAASYLAQKLLVLERRDERMRAKDLVYVHDALMIFAAALDQLAELWRRIEPPGSKRARKVARLAREHGKAIDDDVRRAVDLLEALERPTRPTPTSFAAALSAGLRRVFPS